ncbi:MAG: cytochrome c2 [Planctomycetota bacterium]|jgi:cytochrome c2
MDPPPPPPALISMGFALFGRSRLRSLLTSAVLLGGAINTSVQAAPQMDGNAPELRSLVEHWGCSNCHLPDESNQQRVGKRPGPDLAGVGSRASAAWMKRWIGDPASLRSGPSMPDLFGESAEEQADLNAVVHWLASLGEPAGGQVASEEAVQIAGRELYHQVGCVNCHGALDSPSVVKQDPLYSREVPSPFILGKFSDLAGKWYPSALASFLRDPLSVHRDGRMPNMNLTQAESDLLANYLLSKWGAALEVMPVDEDLAKRGLNVFSERGCQACHVVGEMQFSSHPAPSLAQIDGRDGGQACLSGKDWGGPHYTFPAPQLARLMLEAVTAANHAQLADERLDYLERQTSRLNCQACHEIDGSGGIAKELEVYCASLDESADLGDEGRFPPHLNGVGAKLTTGWFNEVLFESGQARPYLATRMPQYGEAVHDFAELFARKAGVKPETDGKWPTVNDDTVLAGRSMMGMQTGACISCHSFRDFPAVGSPGPNMADFAARLRYTWFDEYMKDPAAIKPGTRMPSFMKDGGSVFPEPYAGDFHKQTDAMWAYFSLGEFMPAPEGVSPGKSLVLQVGDRPRIFRTYLNSAGTRGIAVGNPLGIHFAYDGDSARLMEVWQGAFLDASGAWAGRGGMSRNAEGQVLWTHPGGPAFVMGEKPTAWPSEAHSATPVEFRGYRLDKNGAPSFLFDIGDVSVTERITPHGSPTRLVHEYSFSNLPASEVIWFRPGARIVSVQVKGIAEHSPAKGADGEEWYRIQSNNSDCTLILEVAL